MFILFITVLFISLLVDIKRYEQTIVPYDVPAVERPESSQTEKILKPVKEVPTPTLEPALERVCACESGGGVAPKQFDNQGNVIRGHYNPNDIGMCQINEYWWGDKAKELGFDIYTREGNIKMANWIYKNDSRGIENWSWSKHCWRG